MCHCYEMLYNNGLCERIIFENIIQESEYCWKAKDTLIFEDTVFTRFANNNAFALCRYKEQEIEFFKKILGFRNGRFLTFYILNFPRKQSATGIIMIFKSQIYQDDLRMMASMTWIRITNLMWCHAKCVTMKILLTVRYSVDSSFNICHVNIFRCERQFLDDWIKTIEFYCIR